MYWFINVPCIAWDPHDLEVKEALLEIRKIIVQLYLNPKLTIFADETLRNNRE
jgi:hypothetical protein